MRLLVKNFASKQDSKLGCTESKSSANPSRLNRRACCGCCGMASLKLPRTDTSSVSVSELSGRKKVMLAPGHSLMDWIRLGRAQGDLSGVKDKRNDLTLADLAVHNRPNDMWMALRGESAFGTSKNYLTHLTYCLSLA
ncbi:cytochrome b5 reductase 4 [Elysia marginata]|uniref:Cytochrome b5 reductase 4 n=1 Tax=Elysia marginata TaxID=1093978 RepID=A0AAV4FVP0_9GAST|nr:cytochrome b5 reductase 4 [Elysia marginata]